jgi:hypothetical protein
VKLQLLDAAGRLRADHTPDIFESLNPLERRAVLSALESMPEPDPEPAMTPEMAALLDADTDPADPEPDPVRDVAQFPDPEPDANLPTDDDVDRFTDDGPTPLEGPENGENGAENGAEPDSEPEPAAQRREPATAGMFAKLPAAFIRDERLTFNDWKVYAALRLHSFKSGFCRPFRGTLTAETGLRERTVSTHTTRLQRLGWIRKEGDGGKNKPCQYRVFETPEPDATLPLDGQTVPETRTVTRAQTVPETRTGPVPETRTVTPSNGTGNPYPQGREKGLRDQFERESATGNGGTPGTGGAKVSGKLSLLKNFLLSFPDHEDDADWIPDDWHDEAMNRLDDADCLDDATTGPDSGLAIGFREHWEAAAADGKPDARKTGDGWRLAWLHWVRRAIEYHQRKFPDRVTAIRQKKATAQCRVEPPIPKTCEHCANRGEPLPLPGVTYFRCDAGHGKPHWQAERYPDIDGTGNCVRPHDPGCEDWQRREKAAAAATGVATRCAIH